MGLKLVVDTSESYKVSPLYTNFCTYACTVHVHENCVHAVLHDSTYNLHVREKNEIRGRGEKQEDVYASDIASACRGICRRKGEKGASAPT